MNQAAHPGKAFTSAEAAPAASPVSPEAQLTLVELLRLEGDVRSTQTMHELAILIANETRKITRARQIFVLSKSGDAPMAVIAASGLPTVDRTVPLIQWIERTIARLAEDAGIAQSRDFVLGAYSEATDTTAQAYPMQQALWFPIKYRTGKVVAGVLMTREQVWTSNDTAIAERLHLTFSQAWYWLATSKKSRSLVSFTSKKAAAATALLLAAGMIPVHMTTLAPIVIAPRHPFVVTAPLEGVIEDIAINTNDPVKAGDLLVQFNDTALRNRAAVAEREAEVADARVKKTMLIAVNDISGRHELAIAKAELNVKLAERDFARDLLKRTAIRAEGAGVAVFGDKRDLIGKPVAVGEKIMEVADPNEIEVHADVPVSDAIILKTGARVKVFLDSDPLHPLEADVVSADYQAKLHEAGTMAFRVVAKAETADGKLPRLGTRGTAQLFGDRVSLAYFLFRRPLTSLRQWTGL